jgi:hypothetical protein
LPTALEWTGYTLKPFPDAPERIGPVRELLGSNFFLNWRGSVSERLLWPENIGDIMMEELSLRQKRSISADRLTPRGKSYRGGSFLGNLGSLGGELAFFSLLGTNIKALAMINTSW